MKGFPKRPKKMEDEVDNHVGVDIDAQTVKLTRFMMMPLSGLKRGPMRRTGGRENDRPRADGQ